ncbi:MAG: phosphoribosylformylglycinamidine cyclo-ligase [Solirubrobacteraceae bacterium]
MLSGVRAMRDNDAVTGSSAAPGATGAGARTTNSHAAAEAGGSYDAAGATSSYAAAGVDSGEADRGVQALVEVLRGIDPGRASLAVALPGHFASVLRVAPGLGIALATDSVGSKVILAEQTQRFQTIGIDCVAMNVNDLICVGAQPLALLDYLAVERADPQTLAELAVGLRAGAELAGVEIPGGEVCQLPEVIRGHPSPHGFDLVGSAFGTVALDRIVDGRACAPGDALIGLPASGVHSNGLTLARRALLRDGGLTLDHAPAELGGPTVADALLEPTTIYVRAILDLLRGEIPVHGLAHITGGGVLNLLRLGSGVGYEISAPLPVLPVFELIARLGEVRPAEMWEVFNMGCGFCAIVAPEHAEEALELLSAHHPGAAAIGRLTDRAGTVSLPGLGLEGDRGGCRALG